MQPDRAGVQSKRDMTSRTRKAPLPLSKGTPSSRIEATPTHDGSSKSILASSQVGALQANLEPPSLTTPPSIASVPLEQNGTSAVDIPQGCSMADDGSVILGVQTTGAWIGTKDNADYRFVALALSGSDGSELWRWQVRLPIMSTIFCHSEKREKVDPPRNQYSLIREDGYSRPIFLRDPGRARRKSRQRLDR